MGMTIYATCFTDSGQEALNLKFKMKKGFVLPKDRNLGILEVAKRLPQWTQHTGRVLVVYKDPFGGEYDYVRYLIDTREKVYEADSNNDRDSDS